MPNYQLGKIYKIISDGCDEIYVGSTAMPRLSTRLAKHRADYNRWLAGKTNYTTSFKILFFNEPHNAKIILIETYPCTSKDELRAREEFWRMELSKTEKVVNKFAAYHPGRTRKEKNLSAVKKYQKENREKYNKYHREYYAKKKAAANAN